MQQSIFDFMYKPFKITKPIRLIEFFAGYGSQALALKYLGANFEHHKICEWAVKSIQAYKDIHFTDDNTDYSKDLSIQDVKDYLFKKGISSNYNDPMTKEQIQRLNEKQARTIYNNIQATHNLVNIQQVKGKDLDITDTYLLTYLLTYSFPCQDLSLAGKGKGMSDTSTRSGMLWEVERILSECKELGTMPQVLLMENVPQVHGAENVKDFNKWQLRLEELGYKNYFQDLIATDYGIPQTRNRCFMVSILGDYSYTFPEPIPLKLKLKDMLEENVDEKYFLSNKMIDFFKYNEEKQKANGNGFRFNVSDGNVIAKTITTRAGCRMDDNFIRIKNATKKGYLECYEGDGVDLTQPTSKTRRGRVQKESIQTLTTENNLGVCVKPQVIGGVGEKDSNNNTQWKQQNRVYDGDAAISITTSFNPFYKVNTIGNYSPSNHNAARIVDNEGSAPTVMENHGTITATQDNELKIRKLTPFECFALMGVKKEDYLKCAKNQSDSSLYHLAGDSIVVNVLMAIFKNML